jgi:hypothetical protein
MLHRQVLDVVASGLEACKYGFDKLGYAPFVQGSVTNVVAALVEHWLVVTSRAVAWHQEHADRCIRIRYEDLVRDPVAVVGTLCGFLGVASDARTVENAVGEALIDPAAMTAGDPKVAFTHQVHAESVGHGNAIPLELIPAPLCAEVNRLLEALEYPALGAVGPTAASADPAAARTLARVRARMPAEVRLPASLRTDMKFSLCADDVNDARWILDLKTGAITLEPEAVTDASLCASVADLEVLLDGGSDTAEWVMTGRVRFSDGARRLGLGRCAAITRALQDRRGELQ